MAVRPVHDSDTRTVPAGADRPSPPPAETGSVIATFVAGEVIDERFRIVRLIGQGGMGQVFEAYDLELDAPVALKVIRPEISGQRRSIERFKREVHLARQVTHANVCRIFDLFQVKSGDSWGRGSPPIFFLTMELIAGETLAERLRRAAPLSPRQALPLIRGMANALDAAHRAGVVHLDFKSSNVLLVDGDAGERAVVTDFGLAQASHAAGEPAGRSPGGRGFGGTPAYVAPELVAGEKASAAADVYSFGVVIYEMLTGTLPFRADTAAETARRRLREDPPSPRHHRPDLDPAWEAAVLRCLDRRPERRFARAPEVTAALTGGRARPRRSKRRNPRPFTSFAVVAAVVLGLVAALLAAAFRAPLEGLENRWLDARVYLVPTHPPDHPLLLVLIDDATLADDPTPLIELADDMGRLLSKALDAGAAGAGIDLLLPASWGRSAPFSDLLVRHCEVLALAIFSPAAGDVVGSEVLSGLTAAALGPRRARELFGFVNLDPDGDGVVRRARAGYRDVDGRLQYSFAARVARILLESDQNHEDTRRQEREPSRKPATMTTEKAFSIDFTLDWTQLERISWRDFEVVLDSEPERFRGRFVVVGSAYAGSGDGPHRVPHPRALPGDVPGPVLQALLVHTLLDGASLRQPAAGLQLAASALLAALAAGTVLLARPWWPVLAGALVWGGASYGGFAYDHLILPLTPVLAAMLLAAAGAAVLSRRQSGDTE